MVRVFLVVIAVLALAACTSSGSVPADAPTATPPAMPTSEASPPDPTSAPTESDPSTAPTGGAKTAVLRATTNGPASITYTDGGGSKVREEISRSWEKTIELTDLPAEVSLTIVSDRANSDVGCEVKADGVHIENASSGGSVDATCSTTIS